MESGQQTGYTIVEAMIFIAVSSLLFVSAMTAIGGRQQQVQFTQAVRGFDSQLKDIINDVTTGFFPGFSTVKCTITPGASAATRPLLEEPAIDETVDQGTSSTCIFVGKALQFGPEIDGVVRNDKLLLHTIVGRSTDDRGENVQGIEDANPIAVAPEAENDELDDPTRNYTQEITLDWGLRVNRVVVASGVSAGEYGTLGLFNTFADTQSFDPVAQSQVLDFAPIPTSVIGQTSFQSVELLNRLTEGDSPIADEIAITDMNPAGGVVLCLSDPDGNREAAITLSSDNRRLATTVTFDQVDEAICG